VAEWGWGVGDCRWGAGAGRLGQWGLAAMGDGGTETSESRLREGGEATRQEWGSGRTERVAESES